MHAMSQRPIAFAYPFPGAMAPVAYTTYKVQPGMIPGMIPGGNQPAVPILTLPVMSAMPSYSAPSGAPPRFQSELKIHGARQPVVSDNNRSPLNKPHNISTLLEEEKKGDEESLSEATIKPGCANILGGNAYRRRNVYKSIIKRMASYVINNKCDITSLLRKNGYSDSAMQHAFEKVTEYNGLEATKGEAKKSQVILMKMITQKSIYTFILRETLTTMLHEWEQGKIGRVSKRNLKIYKNVCTKFLKEANKVLEGVAGGSASHLLSDNAAALH